MKKGITPIIAVIILLLITLAMAATAWAFLSGFLSGMTGKSFLINQEISGCIDGKLYVWVKNMGAESIDQDDFLCVQDDTADCNAYLETVTIAPDETKKIIEAEPLTGSHKISLVMGVMTQSVHVNCGS